MTMREGFIVSLVTSQNVTAPKPVGKSHKKKIRLVTSQNVTAPKLINSVEIV